MENETSVRSGVKAVKSTYTNINQGTLKLIVADMVLVQKSFKSIEQRRKITREWIKVIGRIDTGGRVWVEISHTYDVYYHVETKT